MSRTHSALGSVEMVAEGIRCKLCPVTCGRPTRMLKTTFKKLCDHHRNEQRESAVSNYNWKKGQKTSWCQECKGTLPPELELINKGEIQIMAAPKKASKCELCGESKNCFANNGQIVCAGCAAGQGFIKKCPEQVFSLVERFHGRAKLAAWATPYVGEPVAVQLESAALEQIAAAIGYTGTDGDGLIEAVRVAAKTAASGFSVQKSVSQDVVRALDCGEAEWEMAAIQSAAYMGKYRRELKAGELLLDHIADVVSYPGKEAGTLPVFIEGICQEFESVLAEIANVKRATGLDIEEETTTGALTDSVALLAQTLDQYRVRCEELAAKAREHEQLASYREQILLAVKDALGRPLISVGEIPYQVECLVQELEHLRVGADRPAVAPMSSADTVLLDLALDALRGNITGLDPDRIAMLREAV
jgi:hypothetical protein